MTNARIEPSEVAEHKSEFLKEKEIKPEPLDLTIYPELAFIFSQMLAPSQAPPPRPMIEVKEENVAHPDDYLSSTHLQFKLQCKFDSCEVSKYHINNPLALHAIAHQITSGLASSLIIPFFLQATHVDCNKIIYVPSTKAFSNINYECAFNEFWNNIASQENFLQKNDFNLDNLFTSLNLSKVRKSWLNDTVKEDHAFHLETVATLFKIIIFPIATLKNLLQPIYGKDIFVYSILEQQQRILTQQALLNPKFRKFLLQEDTKKITSDLLKAIIKTPLKKNENLAAFEALLENDIRQRAETTATPENLVTFILKHKKLNIEDKENIINSIVDDMVLNENSSSLKYRASLKNIMNIVLENDYISIHSKKELTKKILIDAISQQVTLADVFAIVNELNNTKYSVLKKRSGITTTSFKGSAVKDEKGQIHYVSQTYTDIRRRAKQRMYEIARQNDELNVLLENEDYNKFITTHQDGYWFGYDSLLKYIKDTRSAKKLKQELQREEEIKPDPQSDRAFTHPHFFEKLKTNATAIAYKIKSALWDESEESNLALDDSSWVTLPLDSKSHPR